MQRPRSETPEGTAQIAQGPNRLPAPAFRKALDSFLTATWVWFLTGVVCAVSFAFGYRFVAPGPEPSGARRDLVGSLHAFDATWYAHIATRGYSYDPGSRSSVAFFPLYPLLARFVMLVLRVDAKIALLLVSNASFLAALAVLVVYVRSRFPAAPRELAAYVILAAALFPTACFFRLPYSESTFLLVCAAAMYGIERRWPLAVVAALVGLTTAARPVGVALLAPLALDVCRRESSLGRRLRALARWLPLGCWGIAAYMAYQYAAFGDGLAFAKTQRHWGVRRSPELVARLGACATLEPILAVYSADSPAYWARHDSHGIPWFSMRFANPLFLIAASALVGVGASRRAKGTADADVAMSAAHGPGRWLNRFEISLAATLILIPYATRGYEMGMASTGRFVSVVFPIYLVLGQLLCRLPPTASAALLGASGLAMGIYSLLFVAGYGIF